MITPVFAALLTFLYIFLSLRVIAARRRNSVGLGDGGNADLQRRMRVHANCAEYVPLGLLVMLMAELQDVAAWLIIAIGLLLLAGRLVHAFGVGGESETRGSRTVSMGLTFTALGLGALVGGLVAMT